MKYENELHGCVCLCLQKSSVHQITLQQDLIKGTTSHFCHIMESVTLNKAVKNINKTSTLLTVNLDNKVILGKNCASSIISFIVIDQ